jgi:hypothetical protein
MPHKSFQFNVTLNNSILVQFDYELNQDFKANVSNIQVRSNYHYELPRNPTLVNNEGKYFLESCYTNVENKTIVERHDDPISRRIVEGILNIIEEETPHFH